MREFLSPHNVPFYWEDRLKEEEGYTLYVSDCFWVLATNDYYEFYYNPIHAMGKIHVNQMPQIVKERIKFCSAILHKEDIKFERTKATLMKSPVGFYKIERDMRIGNWFLHKDKTMQLGKDISSATICICQTWKGHVQLKALMVPWCLI